MKALMLGLAMMTVVAVDMCHAQDRSLFQRNTDAIRRNESAGNVGGRATGPDTGPMPNDQRLGGGGLGGGPQGGNRPDGPNVDAINQRNQ